MSHTLTSHPYPLATLDLLLGHHHPTPLATPVPLVTITELLPSPGLPGQQPRPSNRSFVEIPVTKKKPTKAKKNKNMTSADCDAANEEANETMVENLTVTARTLQESGALLAPPARQVGTGVTLASITPSTTTSRIRHEEPEDVPQITTKNKGKGRDLTNLGLSDAEEKKDEGEDAEAEKSDEEGDKEKDANAGSNGEVDGEPKKTDNEDNDEDDSAEVSMPTDLSDNVNDTMEVDLTTPKRPATPTKPTTASKCRASISPTTAHQMGKGVCKDITHASASCTMGGFARGKAMSVALNMADFDTNKESDAPPVMGMLLVYKDGASPLEGAGPVGVKVPIKNTLGPVLTAAAKKMVALTSSHILLWDAEDCFWEAKGSYSTAVKDNEAVIWDDKKKLRIGIQPSEFGVSYLPPSSPSVNSSTAPSAVSSITSSASVSVASTSNIAVNPLTAAFRDEPLFLQIATCMGVPYHMTNHGAASAPGLPSLRSMYAWIQLTKEAKEKWDSLTTPWAGGNVSEKTLHSIFVDKTNFNTYTALFDCSVFFPIIMDMLCNPKYDVTSSAHTTLWGACKPGKDTLAKVLDELEAEKKAEEAKKARDAKKKAVAKKATNITINTDILNLHGQQKAVDSNNQVVTSWMAAFVCSIKDKLQVDVSNVPDESDDDAGAGDDNPDSGFSEDNMDASDGNSNSESDDDMDFSGSGSSGSSDASVSAETIFDTLFLPGDNHKSCAAKSQTTILDKKLDSLCQFLDLYTHNDKCQLCHKLLPISTSSIQPIILITPPVMGCSSAGCHGHGLTQYLHDCDISKVTLLCGSECFEGVLVLVGRCPKCSTMFWADHKSFIDNNQQLALYLPNAKYLKVGKQVWVDHIVSKAIVNANYSFHASTAAITESWNYSFVQPSGASFTLTRRQVWKAFVVESICLLAGFSNSIMIFMDNLKISELVTAA
ncbi:hypothetical protein BDN71DRAFT_1594021 [Pleurotus eryngii]|uniref:CxC5 like cysteine cluster associated with KDZ domain-containing protein n=1 Tax=Pleurotus eryngii TaxID=5323 RepID=A0A9P6D286_PLEER|nr:hypothetical protein BDN71DRAFT_1594021 [Pleurotus eryngii]